MSVRRVSRRPGWLSAAVLTAAVITAGLSACGDQGVVESSAVGVDGQTGEVLLRAVRIVAPPGPSYPAGADAQVRLTLINEAASPDALTGASSPVAAATQLRWDHDCDGSAEPVAEVPLPAAGPGPVHTTLPSAATVQEDYTVWLLDLNRNVLAGANEDVTFTFANAPPITLHVPAWPVAVPPAGTTAATCASASRSPR